MANRNNALPLLVDILSLSAILLVGVFGVIAGLRPAVADRPGADITAEDVEPLPPGSIDIDEFFETSATGRWVGPPFAPAVLVVYSTYTCGFCSEWYGTLRLLRERYPEHLAIVVKNIGDVSSPRPSQAVVPLGAECAGEAGRFEEYHYAAYQNANLLDYSDAATRLAEVAGVPDLVEFDRCLRSARFRGTLMRNAEEVARFTIGGTPTSFLNGRRIDGALPFGVIDRLVALEFPGRAETEARRGLEN